MCQLVTKSTELVLFGKLQTGLFYAGVAERFKIGIRVVEKVSGNGWYELGASHFITRGGSGFLPRSTIFFFCPIESTIFFFFQNESTIFFLLPIRPLFYYMTKRE